jgi:hypothetical protein
MMVPVLFRDHNGVIIENRADNIRRVYEIVVMPGPVKTPAKFTGLNPHIPVE